MTTFAEARHDARDHIRSRLAQIDHRIACHQDGYFSTASTGQWIEDAVFLRQLLRHQHDEDTDDE
jgi:hypothetical protein